MTYKEMNAAVMVLSGLGIAAWVAWQAVVDPAPDLQAIAWRLLYAIGINILVNIGLVIVATIVVSIAQRQEFKDERADDRDRTITDRSMRNGYLVLCIGALAVIVLVAMGYDAGFAAYALFGALVLAGLTDPVSRLIYYRIG